MTKNNQGMPLTHIKAVQMKQNMYGKPEPTNIVRAFEKGDWDKMKQLKGLMWLFIEEIPQPFTDDILEPTKTGGAEMIAFKSYESEIAGKLQYKGK